VHVECEIKSDTGNDRGDWNHFKITQTVPEKIKGLQKKQPYLALHTNCGKCYCKSAKHISRAK